MSRPLQPMRRSRANALLLLAAFIWGSAFVAQSTGMASVGPWTFSGLRFLLGAAVVAPLAWREARAPAAPAAPWSTARGAATVLMLGLLLTAGIVLQQIGMVTTTVTNAGFLTAMYVPMVPFVTWLAFARRPAAALWPAVAACLLGTWWLTGASWQALSPGDRWVLASSLPWALHVAAIGPLSQRIGAPLRLACGQFLVCGLLATAVALAIEPISLAALREAAPQLLYAGVLSVGVAFTLQVVAQPWTPSGDAAVLLSAETLVAALFGALWMGDRLTPTAWAGAGLIAAGMVWIQLQAARADQGGAARAPRRSPSAAR